MSPCMPTNVFFKVKLINRRSLEALGTDIHRGQKINISLHFYNSSHLNINSVIISDVLIFFLTMDSDNSSENLPSTPRHRYVPY